MGRKSPYLCFVNLDNMKNSFAKAHNGEWPTPTEADMKWMMNEYKKQVGTKAKEIITNPLYKKYVDNVRAYLSFTSARIDSEYAMNLAIRRDKHLSIRRGTEGNETLLCPVFF